MARSGAFVHVVCATLNGCTPGCGSCSRIALATPPMGLLPVGSQVPIVELERPHRSAEELANRAASLVPLLQHRPVGAVQRRQLDEWAARIVREADLAVTVLVGAPRIQIAYDPSTDHLVVDDLDAREAARPGASESLDPEQQQADLEVARQVRDEILLELDRPQEDLLGVPRRSTFSVGIQHGSRSSAMPHLPPVTIPTAQSTMPETQGMQTSMTRSTRCLLALLSFAVGGCRREPWGGCPFEDLDAPTDFITPWDTVLGQDMAQLAGAYHGTLTWWDGGDVITVPKAGQELEVEATIEIDATTARMRVYESTREQPYCETDYLSAEAAITFVRIDDGEVELIAPFTLYRDTDASTQYDGFADITPVSELFPDLVPLQEPQQEGISASIWWNPEATLFRTEYRYYGESFTPSTGTVVSKTIVAFDMPE